MIRTNISFWLLLSAFHPANVLRVPQTPNRGLNTERSRNTMVAGDKQTNGLQIRPVIVAESEEEEEEEEEEKDGEEEEEEEEEDGEEEEESNSAS